MDNKTMMIGGIVAVVIIALLAVVFVYIPYVNEQNFNAALQNATVLETEITSAVSSIGSTGSSDVVASSNHTRDVYANEVIPKYNEEYKLLNDSKKYAGGNKVKEDYIDYQLKRIELENKSYSVGDWEEYTTAMSNHDYSKAISASNHMLKTMNETNDELKPVGENIRNLLSTHPNLDKSLHGLSLNPKFYGIFALN